MIEMIEMIVTVGLCIDALGMLLHCLCAFVFGVILICLSPQHDRSWYRERSHVCKVRQEYQE